MKVVSGMQGVRNQERDWGAREEGEKMNRRQQKEEGDDRKYSKKHTRKEKNKRKSGMAQQSFHTRKV